MYSDYGYGYDYAYESTNALVGSVMAVTGFIMLISGVVSILMIISMWKIFKKAGKNGWEAIIPIYNTVVLLQIVELPIWYIALFLVPFANIYAMIKIYIELAHKFGKSTGFGVAMIFVPYVCIPMLAFSKTAVYNGGGMVSQAAPINTVQTNNQYNQPMNQTMNQPMNQPIEQPMNQPMNQPIEQPMNQPIEQPISQPQEMNANPAMPATKSCPNCGSQINATAASCPVCGNQVL